MYTFKPLIKFKREAQLKSYNTERLKDRPVTGVLKYSYRKSLQNTKVSISIIFSQCEMVRDKR